MPDIYKTVLDPVGATYGYRSPTGVVIPDQPGQADYEALQDAVAEGSAVIEPADPPLIVYDDTVAVKAQARTTDDVPLEVFRFPTVAKHRYEASLRVSGIDAGSFASKVMEGRFVWKRATTVATVTGITVVSDLHDAAAAAWAPNCLPSGTDIVFTVTGAAGRTIDWLLKGSVDVFAPDGLGEP
jgi:hypothetical protein